MPKSDSPLKCCCMIFVKLLLHSSRQSYFIALLRRFLSSYIVHFQFGPNLLSFRRLNISSAPIDRWAWDFSFLKWCWSCAFAMQLFSIRSVCFWSDSLTTKMQHLELLHISHTIKIRSSFSSLLIYFLLTFPRFLLICLRSKIVNAWSPYLVQLLEINNSDKRNTEAFDIVTMLAKWEFD